MRLHSHRRQPARWCECSCCRAWTSKVAPLQGRLATGRTPPSSPEGVGPVGHKDSEKLGARGTSSREGILSLALVKAAVPGSD